MTTRTTWTAWILAFLIGGAVFGVSTAQAGNAPVTGAQYFSVELDLNEYLYDTGPGSTILIDDITYSMNFKVCDALDECEFFVQADVPPDADTPAGTPWLMPLGPGISGPAVISTTAGGGDSSFKRNAFVLASKALFSEIALEDRDGSEPSQYYFDRFSVKSYGQMFWVEGRESNFVWGMSSSIAGFPNPVADSEGLGIGVGAAGGVGVGEGLSATYEATPSSGSRHYQSPHIVQNGRVYLKQTSGSYLGIIATANIKGRVIPSGTTPPASASTISVVSP